MKHILHIILLFNYFKLIKPTSTVPFARARCNYSVGFIKQNILASALVPRFYSFYSLFFFCTAYYDLNQEKSIENENRTARMMNN